MTNTPPEPIEEYTPQQIEDAKKEIANLKPADYLALRHYIESVEDQTQLPEAGFIIFTELRSPNSGAALNMTVRATNPITGLDSIAQAMRYARIKYGLLPVQKHSVQRLPEQPKQENGHPVTPAAPITQSAPHTPAAPKAPAAPAASKEPVYVNEDVAEGNKGTNVLNKISVTEGKVEFYVGKFKYPFKDSRGAAVVAGLFDEDLGWTEDHFKVKAALYTPEDWGNMTLYADWEKPAKYYNIVRIHA